MLEMSRAMGWVTEDMQMELCVGVGEANDDDLDGVPTDLDEPDLALKVRVALGKLVFLWVVGRASQW